MLQFLVDVETSTEVIAIFLTTTYEKNKILLKNENANVGQHSF